MDSIRIAKKLVRIAKSLVADEEMGTYVLGKDTLQLNLPVKSMMKFYKSSYWKEISNLFNESKEDGPLGLDPNKIKRVNPSPLGKDYSTMELTFDDRNNKDVKSPKMTIQRNLDQYGLVKGEKATGGSDSGTKSTGGSDSETKSAGYYRIEGKGTSSCHIWFGLPRTGNLNSMLKNFNEKIGKYFEHSKEADDPTSDYFFNPKLYRSKADGDYNDDYVEVYATYNDKNDKEHKSHLAEAIGMAKRYGFVEQK